MPSDCISYRETGYFSALINDYLDRRPELQPLYNRFPSLENFREQIAEKSKNYNPENRKILVQSLQSQYFGLEISPLTRQNIASLSDSETFTVTTGHQLNLFTGPLYFLYKIISAVNLAKTLKATYPECNFVPVYWMATEDHDFEEINYFNFNGRKFRWNRESSGAVGRLSTEGLGEVYEVFSAALGQGQHADELRSLFKNAYLNHGNLTEATRFLANELFKNHGLVIVDGDDKNLKNLFAPYVRKELEFQRSFEKVSETISKLQDYDIQVNPREINLFYLDEGVRERIVFENNLYKINNTNMSFSKDEILKLTETSPGKFSPNVIMRPLYEEIILPNLCYIGGGGEIAYWLELKSFFAEADVTFPILLLRNSALLSNQKQVKKAEALGLTFKDLFLKQSDLFNLKIRSFSEFPIDLSEQKDSLKKQFDALKKIADQTDKSFTGAVNAQEAKQMKGLQNLEKRLLKAQKRKHADELERIGNLQNELFPMKSLQERNVNFASFYLDHGAALISTLISELDPLEFCYAVVVS